VQQKVSESGKIRRVLVAIDASPQSLAALEAAAELAAGLDAELLGVYVEDINLIRLAALPVVLEIGGASARTRQLDGGRMDRQLRSQAARAAQAMATAASRAQVRWSFTVARGSIETELLQAASEADLFILGRAGWSGKRRLGSTARKLVAAGTNRTMIIERGERLLPTLMTAYDGSGQSQRALDTAISLGEYLAVGIVAENEEQAKALQSEVAAKLDLQGLQARYRWLVRADASELANMVRTQEECILILPGQSPLLEGKNLPDALDEFECPVLLVQ
jgi:nucleotide-binding universal stress UspA family protein